jgi:hypothetical protein
LESGAGLDEVSGDVATELFARGALIVVDDVVPG